MRQLRRLAIALVIATQASHLVEDSKTAMGQETLPAQSIDAKSSDRVEKGQKADSAVRDEALRKSKRKNRTAGSDATAYPFPTFSVDEVLDRLTERGSRLHKQGKTKSDAELRKQLDRTSCELKLAAASTEVLGDRDSYRRASESVFLVSSLYKGEGEGDWQTSLATAFVVAADGVLATSCHVFDNEDSADAVIVMDVKKNIYPVTEILAANKFADTCLFRIDATDLKPLAFGEDAPPGSPVRVLAHPGDSFFFYSTGVVSNYERDEEGAMWMNVTADFGQGSSGGPVMDEFGNVIGQVSRTYTLYAGGSSTRGRPRRVADITRPRRSLAQEKRDGPIGKLKNDLKDEGKGQGLKSGADSSEMEPDEADFLDPQLVFKSCVPVRSLRSLIKQK